MRAFGSAEPNYPWWWLLEVEGEEQQFLVHGNWISHNGMLKPGDEIELVEARVPVYSDCPFRFVAALRRCGKEASVVE